jgi:hypothetical protein
MVLVITSQQIGTKMSLTEATTRAIRKASKSDFLSSYLKLKEDYDDVKSAQVSAEENIQAIIQENEDLRSSARFKWFIQGAVVLLFGWFLRWSTSRSRKMRRPYYSV